MKHNDFICQAVNDHSTISESEEASCHGNCHGSLVSFLGEGVRRMLKIEHQALQCEAHAAPLSLPPPQLRGLWS